MMASDPETPLDVLWTEYSRAFRDYDDLTLARWMAQTLGQFAGKTWRLSHPLLGAYRLVAQVAHERQIWLKRLASAPAAYPESPCCRAPLLPLLTRDVEETGLVCEHCNETAVPFDELPGQVQAELKDWASEYRPVHAVAHWETAERKRTGNYERAFEEAAKSAERLLGRAGKDLAPHLLEFYPTVVWEDQDDCLEVRPEDVKI